MGGLVCSLGLVHPAPLNALTEVITASAPSASPNNWTLAAGATKQVAVAPPNDDIITYITSTPTNNTQQQFVMTDPVSIGAGDTINSVSVITRMHRGGSNNVSFLMTYVVGANTSPGAGANIGTTTWTDFTETIGRPTGGSWTLTDLNNLEVRMQNTQGFQLQCSTLTVSIDYSTTTTTTSASTTTTLVGGANYPRRLM